MTQISRRTFSALAIGGAFTLAACGNGIGGRGADTIDARVQATLQQLYTVHPNAREIAAKSAGQLVMPLVTEAGLGIGGGYGRGALVIDGTPVDYYSAAKANIGLQIGAQQYSHVLFFMTQEALLDFRRSQGWAAGADVEYAIPDQGQSLGTETTSILSPVIAYVFGQAGLRIGATLEGVKYTRIIP
jgi:lipid-binding SYLF domain-containing protein